MLIVKLGKVDKTLSRTDSKLGESNPNGAPTTTLASPTRSTVLGNKAWMTKLVRESPA